MINGIFELNLLLQLFIDEKS